MSFCQACGAKNADDARFCNACGARIVKGVSADAPPAAAPTPASDAGATRPARASSGSAKKPSEGGGGNNVWSMPSQAGAPAPSASASRAGASSGQSQSLGANTLAGVGIPSQGRTYGTLAAVAFAFLAIGALLMWLIMRSSGETTATAETTTPTPDRGGTPALPGGVEVPDDEGFESGGSRGGGGRPGGASSGGSGGSGSGGSTGATEGSAGSTGGSSGGSGGSGTGSTGGGSTGSGSTGSGSTGSGSTGSGSTGSGSTGSGSTGGGSTGSGSTGSGSTGSGSTGSGSTGSGSTGSGSGSGSTGSGDRDWEAMGETVGDEPADYEMSLYVSNVRRFIRNNYARQATACFSRASAAGGSTVSGRVVIGFTISSTGATENVHVVRNDPGITTLGTCLVNRVDSWDLPAPPRREPIDLEMPFTS